MREPLVPASPQPRVPASTARPPTSFPLDLSLVHRLLFFSLQAGKRIATIRERCQAEVTQREAVQNGERLLVLKGERAVRAALGGWWWVGGGGWSVLRGGAAYESLPWVAWGCSEACVRPPFC